MSQRAPRIPKAPKAPTLVLAPRRPAIQLEDAPSINDREMLDRAVLDLAGPLPPRPGALAKAEAEVRAACVRLITRPGDPPGHHPIRPQTVLAVAVASSHVEAAETARATARAKAAERARAAEDNEHEGCVDDHDLGPAGRRGRAGLVFVGRERVNVTVLDLPDEEIRARQVRGELVVSARGARDLVDDPAHAVIIAASGARIPPTIAPIADRDSTPDLEGFIAELEAQREERKRTFWDLEAELDRRCAESEVLDLGHRIEAARQVLGLVDLERRTRAKVIASNTPRAGGRGRRGKPAEVAAYEAPLVEVLGRLVDRGWRQVELVRLIHEAPRWERPPFAAVDLPRDPRATAKRVSPLLKRRKTG